MSHPVRLAYYTVEPKDGADVNMLPILFLHGATSLKEQWSDIPQIVANKTGRKAFVLDARNHGDSEWSDTFDFDKNVDDTLFFMKSHQLGKVFLIGHSMGGVTSMKIALKHPEKVEGIIIEDMTVKNIPKEMLDNGAAVFEFFRSALEKAPSELDEDAARKFITDSVFKHAPANLKEELKKHEIKSLMPLRRNEHGKWQFKTNFEVIRKSIRGNKLISEYEGTFDGPAYFIYGGTSPFQIKNDEEKIKTHFPNARMFEIERAGHCIHTEEPEAFTEAVLKFFQV